MSSKYRSLFASEIEVMKAQNCFSPDWTTVKVCDGFNPDFIKNCHLEGDIRIGSTGEPILFLNRVRPSGIYNAILIDTSIGNNCYINGVHGCIRGIDLHDRVLIENCYLIESIGDSNFGNGTKVAVLNEAGGREIAIFDKLSAQLAYILTFYRYKTEAISKIDSLIENYIATTKSERATIENGAILRNCGEILNVNIGECAELISVSLLQNGTISSSVLKPTRIGHAVIAKNFIFSVGAEILEGANINRCFIGESTILAKGYCAEDSILLSNGQFYNGEACAVFAGPHTVTHHKSTLLIGGAFSFFNAGSGTNQSNHLYKIGPVHQGITERGVKTGSDSYMLWPAHIGAFSVILGRHYNHPNISDLPFSYLIEKEGESVLIPGLNLKSIGTYRDINKWEKRDRRSLQSNDIIDYDISNWYIIGKLLRGIELLKGIQKKKEATQYSYNGVSISSGSLLSGIKTYRQAIIYYIGLKLFSDDNKIDQLLLDPKVELLSDFNIPEIIDVAGMFANKEKLFSHLDTCNRYKTIEELMADIKGSRIAFSMLDEMFIVRKHIWDTYSDLHEWELKLKAFLMEFITSVTSIHSGICSDSKKEFNEASKLGFGIDGDLISRNVDFDVVRGKAERLKEIGTLEILEKRLLGSAERYIELLNRK